MKDLILVIDQGTTSTRAIIFDRNVNICAKAQSELTQYYPADGWVEHDGEEIWLAALSVCRQALAAVDINRVAGIGITNQRETTLVWHRNNNRLVHPAIVWQDRRTAKDCEALKKSDVEATVCEKTGLLLDPYFSATKLRWILNQSAELAAQAQAGDLAFGTIDSFLLWRLTGGRVHRTDISNASRTLLFNINSAEWDQALLSLFDIPAAVLPEVSDNVAEFGETAADLFGRAIPILGMAGDQQAALIGQGCFAAGSAKCTFGTGSFLVVNTGDKRVNSSNRLLATIAYRIGGELNYALEGSVFIAGAVVQWLRDGLKLITDAEQTQSIAESSQGAKGVYFIPAFTGLGAPYWDATAKGAIMGLRRDSGIAELVCAALESAAFQTKDLLIAMQKDGAQFKQLRVDGGMIQNDWLLQNLADHLRMPVERAKLIETTALGAAFLAGLGAGVFRDFDHLQSLSQVGRVCAPKMSEESSKIAYQGWCDAIGRVLSQ